MPHYSGGGSVRDLSLAGQLLFSEGSDLYLFRTSTLILIKSKILYLYQYLNLSALGLYEYEKLHEGQILTSYSSIIDVFMQFQRIQVTIFVIT